MAVEVTKAERANLPYRATVSLEVTFPDGEEIRGTGAIVGMNDLLTATHMLYDPEHGGLASSIAIYPGADYNDRLGKYEDPQPYSYSFAQGTWTAQVWANQVFADADDSTLVFSESQYDVAVVGLNVAVGTAIGGWFDLNPGFNNSQYAYSLGYPSGSTGMMKATTWITRDPNTSVYSSYFDQKGDLMGQGSSGGPLYVMSNGTPELIGVKSSGTAGYSNHWADIGLLYNQIENIIAANDTQLTQQIEDDYAATIGTLGILTVSQPATGSIQFVGDYDWFKVILEAGKTYQFNLTGTTLSDPSMRLMNGIGKQLAENDDININTNLNSQIVFTVINSGTYFIEASAFENTSGNYNLSMQEIVDKTAPTVSQFSPAKNANAVPVDANIVFSFDELVKLATGKITLEDTYGQVIESFDVATGNDMTLSGVTLTINPTLDLQNSHDYLLLFDTGAVTDLAGNAYSPTENYAFATKASPLSGTNKADKMLGTNYADTLYGLAGKDRLNGGLADDYLDGGKGADTLVGGPGNDTYVIDNAGDKIVETGLTDTSDTVISSISYSLGSKLENLTLTGNAKLSANGNSLANRLIGNANNNSLNGKAGADDIYGGLGNDKLTGGTGEDLFVFDSTLAKNNVDTITDFARGQDLLVLDSTIFSQFNGQASDFIAVPKLSTGSYHGEHMIFDKTAHTLYYDADGTGTGAAPEAFVKLVGISNLDANDLILN